MSGLFDPDGKIMYYGMKFANLMWLQLLTLLCCIPVITAGAAFTAMHKILLQLRRDEDGSVTKTYFKAFISNFRQATVIWIGYLAVLVALFLDYQLTAGATSMFLIILRYLVPVALILVLLSLSWVFVLLSRYHNSILGTLRLSFMACLAHPLYSVIMTVLMLLPVVLMLLTWELLPFLVLLGFTVPGFLRAMIYSKVFDQLEDTEWKKPTAEETPESEAE